MSHHPRLAALVGTMAVLASLLFAGSPAVGAQEVVASDAALVISGIVDGDLTGGLPKAIEVTAVDDIADLSAYGLANASNGAASPGASEFDLPSVPLATGESFCVTSDAASFEIFFGFAADAVNNVANNNGDDAVELYHDGAVVDVYGVVGTNGDGEPWDYTDGWAKRVSGGPSATFVESDWTFSGLGGLDGESSNATAANPFPTPCDGFGGEPEPGAPEFVITEIMQNPSAVGDSDGEYLEIANVGTEAGDLAGHTLADDGTDSVLIDTSIPVPADGFVVLCKNTEATANGGIDCDGSLGAMNLSNGDDEVVLLDSEMAEVDRVVYDGGPNWPDPDGASMNLDPASTDADANDDSENWCEATSTFGDGDLGTPGAANDECITVVEPPATVGIHDVQGSGATAAITDPVTVQGIVVGQQVDDDAFEGFFLQEEDADADADAATSEGIFVYCNGPCAGGAEPAVGDQVTVSGTPSEFSGQTQIGFPDAVSVDATAQPLPTPATITLPAAAGTTEEATFESVEGMLVTIDTPMVVSEYFELNRYGQVLLTANERPRQFTQTNAPDIAGYQAHLAALDASQIRLQDTSVDQNDALNDLKPELDDAPLPFPTGGLSITNRFRGGDTFTGLTGVMNYYNNTSNSLSNDEGWSVRTVEEAFDYIPAATNPAPAQPDDVGGTMTVASYNVLNYFLTIDERGANSDAELARQHDKIVAALAAIEADVFGLIEIENDADNAAAQALVDGLNAALGGGNYAVVDTGQVGTDEIKQAFIYNADTVELAGDYEVLDTSDDARFIDTKNRPMLVQTFTHLASGETVTVAVNHLKSKGSDCNALGDPDKGDGAGNCDGTRTDAATAIADFLADEANGFGDNVLIIGDLNAYAMEAPITTLTDAGYVDLVHTEHTVENYSYLFDGQLGSLDHALGSPAIADLVTGTTTWHINADEPVEFDYNDEFQTGTEAYFNRESAALPLYEPNELRSSDHDPVIVGLDLVADTEVPEGFDDVDESHQFFEAIEWMRTEGLSTGVENPDGGLPNYLPLDVVRRQAMAAFLYRLAGEPALTNPETPFFADVDTDHQFYDAIQWMGETGTSTGVVNPEGGAPLYLPETVVKRQAMAAFLYRLAGEPALANPETPFFVDVATGHQFYDAIQWMGEAGVSTGSGGASPRFIPGDSVLRQAMAAFLYRMYGTAES